MSTPVSYLYAANIRRSPLAVFSAFTSRLNELEAEIGGGWSHPVEGS